MEEQPTNKIIQIRYPLIFAAGLVALLLQIGYLIYDWLLRKEAVAGPELQTESVLMGLVLLLCNHSSANLKRRWMKPVLLFWVLALSGLLAVGVFDMFRPFPEQTQYVLAKLTLAVSLAAMIYTFVIALAYPQPYERKKLSRKEKVKTAIIVIFAIAGYLTFYFGGRQLAYWLLTR